MLSKQDVILIAVSNAQVGAQLEMKLRAALFQAEYVPDGSTVRARIAEGNISLVVLDEDLPDAQGIDLAAEITQQRPELPIILFGAQDSPELLKRALRRGVVDFLTPPLKTEGVLRAVRAALDFARRREETILAKSPQQPLRLQKQVDELEMLTHLENARLYAEMMNEYNQLETILAEIQDGVIVVDQDFRLVMANRTAREAFHLDPEITVKGRPFRDVFSQPELVDLIIRSEASLTNRTEISLDDSRSFAVDAIPIQGVGRALFLYDITTLKKIGQIKADFLHSISHDLRSPLTAILGYVELIDRAGPVTDLQRDFIRRVQGSVHNITRLINNLLELARIESGFDARKEKVSLEQIVQNSAEGLKKSLAKKNHHLSISLPDEMPEILAYPVQIRQMIDHLLENAILYTPSGGTITILGRLEGDQVILQISDTGIGIPSTDLPFVFDKLYRASNTSLDQPDTGLGLVIVKSIVENHAGRIWVDSTLGEGATFTIALPVAGL